MRRKQLVELCGGGSTMRVGSHEIIYSLQLKGIKKYK